MFERLEQIESKYEELNQALASPEIVSDSQRYQKTARAHSELQPIVEKYREYKDLTRGVEESKALDGGRRGAQGPAAAQRSERREERHRGNPRRHRRRRSHALRGGNLSHVL